MPVIDFSEDDILRGKLVTPDWYRVKIGSFLEKLSKNGDSTNWIFENSKILYNAENGSKDFAGVPLMIQFNSKAKGFLVGFFAALGADVKPGARFELKNAEDKEIDVYVENDTYEGRIVNRVNHKYRTPREVPA